MAVYRRNYRPYQGRLTERWTRPFVLARYSLAKLFEGRFLNIFLVLCYLPPLVAGIFIYLHHNLGALQVIQIRPEQLMPINNDFFFLLVSTQGMWAFLLTAYAGPGLVAPDLSDNALPLYLSRPISRAEYVLGKMAVLFILLSAITWLPCLLLFVYQAQLAGGAWLRPFAYLAGAIVAGSLIWTAVLSLLALSISAWVKWRLAASGTLFGVFFLLSGFGETVNSTLGTHWGTVLNLGSMMSVVWLHLFRTDMRSGFWAMFQEQGAQSVPFWAACLTLLLVCAGCLLLLNRRLQAREVVK